MHQSAPEQHLQYIRAHACLSLVALPQDELVALLQPHAGSPWAHVWNGGLPRLLLDALGEACRGLGDSSAWVSEPAAEEARQNLLALVSVMQKACVGVELERQLLNDVESLRTEPQWRLVVRFARELLVMLDAGLADRPLDVPALLGKGA